MSKIYKIIGGGRGRVGCGHVVKGNECYYLIDMKSVAHTACDKCGKEKGFDRMWGTRKPYTAVEMHNYWFGGDKLEEVVCGQLKKFTHKLINSSKREEMLEVAVEV